MRTISALIFLLFVSNTFAQTIRRVNADPTVTGTNVYQTLQAAHDAAAAGDVLIVEPGNSVGDLNCIKALTIYGRGFFLDKNPNYVAMSNSALTSTVGFIYINSNNVKISGVNGGRFFIAGVSNTIISRCNIVCVGIAGLSTLPANNITISQNYITGAGSNDPNLYAVAIAGVSNGQVSNVMIMNNQLIGIMNTNGLNINSFSSGITVNQNVIVGIANSFNTTFLNNIFVSAQTIPFSTNGSIFFNNAFPQGSTIDSGMGSNNQNISNLSSQFISNAGGSEDNNYRVSAGSPLKTLGSTGGEVGMFGGANPYVQYGIPAAPAVTKLRSDGVGNSNTPITLTISAKSNN